MLPALEIVKGGLVGGLVWVKLKETVLKWRMVGVVGVVVAAAMIVEVDSAKLADVPVPVTRVAAAEA